MPDHRFRESCEIAGDASHKNGEWFESLVKLSSDWYWEQDKAFRFIELSDGVKKSTQTRMADIVGKTRWELPTVGVSHEQWEAHRAQLRRHEPFRDFEYCRTNDHGDVVWMSVSGNPIFDAFGEFTGYHGTGQNITTRKQAEEALRASEERLRLSTRAARIGTFLIDIKQDLIHYSPELSEMLGLSGTISVPVEEAFARIHRDDIDRVLAQYATVLSPTGEGRLQLELRFVRPGGEIRWMWFNGEAKFSSVSDGRTPFQVIGACQDITARKNAENALLYSEERFRSLVSLSVDWYWEQDEKFRFIEFSETAMALVGTSAASLLGKARWELTTVGVSEAQWREHRELLERHEPFRDLEYQRFNETGEFVWVSVNGDPIFDASGKFNGYCGTGHNITRRKQAEEAMREGEARLRLALDVGEIGMWDWDLTSDTATVSDIYREQYGFDSEDHVNFAAWFARVQPDDRDRLVQLVQAKMRAGSDFVIEFRIFHPNLGERWLVSRGRVVRDASGRPIRLFGVQLDITDRKNALHKSETRFQETFNHAAIGIAITDWDGNFQQCNPAYCAMLGYTEEEFKQMSLGEIFHPDDRELNLIEARRLEDGDASSFEIENRYVHKDGHPVWVHKFVSAIPDDIGKPMLRLGLVTDITTRKQTEEALALAQRLESVGKLAGGVAHDFNNLLAAIGGNLELAARRINDDETKELISDAMEAVASGASLNARLLSFARRRRLEPARLVINVRVMETMRLLERTLGEHIALKSSLKHEVWETLVDPGEIDSALLNLAVNARDAMPDGGSLIVETRNVTINDSDAEMYPNARAGEYVCLSVADTGMGMTANVLNRAIDPFFTTKEPGEGTGLGLSSVYGFAEQSGGFVKLASEMGVGTTVSIFLPRATTEAVVNRSASGEVDEPLGNGELILVVEDEELVRKVTLGRLKALGYAVLEAKTGSEAIEQLEAGEPVALVFSDIVMPGRISGYDLARWTVINKPRIGVLLTSGYNEGDVRRDDQLTLKHIEILDKPYSLSKLARSVRGILDAIETQAGFTSPVNT